MAPSSRRGDEETYSRKARERGYPARSVFKLEQIDRRVRLLRANQAVLDLGAAPGSWSLYALTRVGKRGHVTAVDVADLPGALAPHLGVRLEYLQLDITSLELGHRLAGVAFDVVLCDAAPATSGNRIVDSARSQALVESALAIAIDHLRAGGDLVAKLLQGEDIGQCMAAWRAHFAAVRTIKPSASRSESRELFLFGTGYLGAA